MRQWFQKKQGNDSKAKRVCISVVLEKNLSDNFSLLEAVFAVKMRSASGTNDCETNANT